MFHLKLHLRQVLRHAILWAFFQVLINTTLEISEFKVGEDSPNISLLDAAVEKICTKLMMTFPNCLSKTINSIRKKKLEHWDGNKESNRDWLALNMMTEAKAGFKAFNDGPRGDREVDFVKLRQMLAQGQEWNDDVHQAISPQYKAENAS